MGKKKKNLSPRERQQKELRKQKARRAIILAKWKKAAFVAACVVVALAVLLGLYTVAVTIVNNTGVVLRNRTALSSAHFEVDSAMFSCYYYDTYRSLTEGEDASEIYDRIDDTIPLRDQSYTAEESWFDYFLKKTTTRVSDMLLYAEGAKAANVTLSSADKDAIEKKISDLKTEAEAQDISLDDLISSRFGRGVKEKDLRRAMELEALADKHYAALGATHIYTDEEIDLYYAENSHLIDLVDYKSFTVTSVEMSEEAAEELAKDLAKCETPEAFDAWLREHAGLFFPGEEAPSEDSISNMIEATKVEDYAYQSGNPLDVFLFEKAEKVCETTVIKGESEFTVCMVLSLPKREEYPAVTVRNILVDILEYGSVQEAREVAQTVFAKCKNGMKEADFIALSSRHDSTVPQFRDTLLQNLTKHTLDEMASAVTDWCFAPHEKGDVGMVQSEQYGFHILYFVGTGEPAWKVTVRKMMDNEAYDGLERIYEKYKETYTVEINESAAAAVMARCVL